MKVVNERQTTQFQSPWGIGQRVAMVLWEYAWLILCSWTPKPFNWWRLIILRLFGAKLTGKPFVHQRARIQIPWNLQMDNRACLGDRSIVYTLGEVVIGEAATIAQEAYLCTGSHDFKDPALPLIVGRIEIKSNAFVGARAMILPGITIGQSAVVGAMAVVTKDVGDNQTVVGNPAVNILNKKNKT